MGGPPPAPPRHHRLDGVRRLPRGLPLPRRGRAVAALWSKPGVVAVENIPSIRKKAEFCYRWIGSIERLDRIETRDEHRQFLLNLITFASAIEGLFFFAVFASAYFLRSKGLLNGLADGANWVFPDESCHMNFAFQVVETVRAEEPELFDEAMEAQVRTMLREAVECEYQFAEDVLADGVPGMSLRMSMQGSWAVGSGASVPLRS